MKTPNPDHPIRNTLARLALASTMGAAMFFGASPASAADGLNASTYLGPPTQSLLAPISNLMALTPNATGTTTATIDFHGGTWTLPGSPSGDNFSVLWEGWFDVTKDGTGVYTFGTSSDDGSMLYLDLNADGDFEDPGELIVSNNNFQPDTPATGQVDLQMNSVRMVIGYYQGGGGYDMRAAFKKGTGVGFGDLNLINSSLGYFFTEDPYATLTVGLISPLNAEAIFSGTSVTASAFVADPGAFTHTVTFHVTPTGGPTVETVSPSTSSPYTADLGPLANGSYEIYASVVNSDTPAGTATSAPRPFTVAPAVGTTIEVVSSGSPSSYGDEVTFTATVSGMPTGGTVQFLVGDNYLGAPVSVITGKASVTTTTLDATTHAITAQYSGFQIYGESSTAVALSQVVEKAVLTVRATSFVRPTNTPNPDPLPSAFFGYKNGQNILTSGVTGTPVLTTDAGPGIGTYDIICNVGTLAADNYSFTAENGVMTVAEPVPTTLVPGGDFQMFKPGTGYFVTAEFDDESSYAGGVGDGLSLTGGTITYSDGTQGFVGDGIPDFDLPGWAPLQAGNDLLNNGVGGSNGLNIFAAWGGNGRIQTTDSLFTVEAGQTVTITAMVGGPDDGPIGGPLAFHLLADGVQLVPTSLVDPTLPNNGAFQMISRTYNAAVLAPHVGKTTTIVLGVENANNAANRVIFDDVRLETTTVPPGPGFATWAAANAPGQTPSQDHDDDGVENGIEYFMGKTGSSFTAMPGLDATNTVTWPMDAGYVGTYEVQTSPDLATWTNVVPKPVPTGGNLSYTLPPGAEGGRSFLRLLVTPTP